MKVSEKLTPEGLKDLASEHTSVRRAGIPRLWLIVADDRIAKVFRDNGHHLEFLGQAEPPELPRGLTNKSVGRVVSSSGASLHHKYEPHAAARYHENTLFMRQLADWLDSAAAENVFDRLIIAAAPRALGNLRHALSKRVRSYVVSEVSKTLTRHTEAQLREEIEKAVLQKNA